MMRLFTYVVVFVLTLGTCAWTSGCAPLAEDGSTGDDPSGARTVDVAGEADAGWLSGGWRVEHTLDAISSAIFEEAADQGVVTTHWEISEDGSTQLQTEDATFTGVTVFGGDEFRFEGEATYEEPDGSTASSDIVVDGTRAAEDAWEGVMYGRVRAEGEFLYEASWLLEAARVP